MQEGKITVLWTEEELERIKLLKASGLTLAQIGYKIGRTEKSVLERFSRMRRDEKEPRPRRVSSGNGWTREEFETVLKLREQKVSWPEIAVMVRRTQSSVRSKIDRFETTKLMKHEQSPRITVPEANESDRRRRQELSHRSLTAAFFGDPLPGQSALDRREQLA